MAYKTFSIFLACTFLFCIHGFSQKKENKKKTNAHNSDGQAKHHIRQFLDTLNAEGYISDNELRPALLKELKRYYQFNGYQLSWCTEDDALPRANMLMDKLSKADEDGLFPSVYQVTALEDYQDFVFNSFDRELEDVVCFDIKMTAAFLTYAWHMYNGNTRPEILFTSWHRKPLNEHLAQYLAQKDFDKALKVIVPDRMDYLKLRTYLATYQDIAQRGGWEELQLTDELGFGDHGEEVIALRLRLAATGDISLKIRDVQNPTFDEKLEAAVKNFQFRHGLHADGVVGANTLQALNIPIEERIRQIYVNMERLRHVPATMPSNYIYVNIPEFKVYVYDNDEIKIETNAIVGTSATNTPVFNDEMEYIIFSPATTSSMINPNGTVSKNALNIKKPNYIAPISSNEDFLSIEESNKSSTNKNLGILQSNKPDAYYLCQGDASIDRLFNQENRALSNGEIIIQSPEKLTDHLLKGQRKWKLNKSSKKASYDSPTTATLSKTIKLFVDYRTCWVDATGNLHFREDVYGFDKSQFQYQNQHLYDKGRELNAGLK